MRPMTPPPTQACAPQRKPETRRLLPIEWEQEIGYAISGIFTAHMIFSEEITLQQFMGFARHCKLTKLPPNPQA
jgi:hypothetical protein